MRLTITHTTIYSYDFPISALVQSVRLTPSVHQGQRIVDWTVEIPGGTLGPAFRDGAGDWVQGWTLKGPVSQVTVIAGGIVETADSAGVLRGHREVIHPLVYMRDTQATRRNPALSALAAQVEAAGPLDLAHGLSALVADSIAYVPGATEPHTSAAEVLELGEGVCQDQAHVLIAMARCRDLPARYVSGYLRADKQGKSHEAAHAWAEIYIDSLGWVGFDPTNRCCPDDRYVRLGSGFDATDAAPLRGMALGAGAERLEVSVAVGEKPA